MKKVVLFIPAIVWFTISLWLFTLPGSALPKLDLFNKFQGDKLVHAVIFFILGIAFMYPLQSLKNRNNTIRWFILFTVLFIAYGIAIEFIQDLYIPFRSFDVGDILADIFGSICALWLGIKYWAKK